VFDQKGTSGMGRTLPCDGSELTRLRGTLPLQVREGSRHAEGRPAAYSATSRTLIPRQGEQNAQRGTLTSPAPNRRARAGTRLPVEFENVLHDQPDSRCLGRQTCRSNAYGRPRPKPAFP
jgi:hypothetical protein